MCGICGFTKNNGPENGNRLIREMNGLLFHRGPDDEGFFADEGVSLGHRRLSIIDLSGGKQPIKSKGRVIVFNGEIYNYKKLRECLSGKGYEFRTDSDTEVLVKMYEEYGEKCLDFLNGMFVFAIWDGKNKELFIARDRLGIKPLYYSIIDKDIIFASEIKSILKHPSVRKKLNGKVLNSYFQYRYILGEETFFKNIFILKAGHYLKFNLEGGDCKIEKYWELPPVAEKQKLEEGFYIERVQEMLIESIRKRMISDVPVGAYLSGGLDSSIVASVMASLCKDKNLETFTIGFKEEGYNEFSYSRMVAEKWGTNHHEILLTAENYFETMESLIALKDAPLAVPNEVPLYLMSKELKKYITVVLSGEGADELFGGYGRIFISYLNFCKSGRKDEDFLDFFLEKYNYVSDSNLEKFLDGDIVRLVRSGKYTRNIFEEYIDKTSALDIRDKIPYIFQNLHLQGLLQRVDFTTMAASVEGRVPFVDHELIEFVNGIPFEYKIRWKDESSRNNALDNNLSEGEISESYDITKYLLREAFAEYLPAEIIKRKKVGFPVPLDNWFNGDFQGYAKDILLDRKTLDRGIYDAKYLKSGKFIKELNGINIWMMLNLELFFRKYFD